MIFRNKLMFKERCFFGNKTVSGVPKNVVIVSYLSIWIDCKLVCMDSSVVYTDNSD